MAYTVKMGEKNETSGLGNRPFAQNSVLSLHYTVVVWCGTALTKMTIKGMSDT